MRVLVREVNWLGDLVISLPALRAVRDAWPEGHLAVLVKSDLASFFDGFDWVDEVLPFATAPGVAGLLDRLRLAGEVRGRRFDLAVVLPKSFDAALVPALARVPRRVGWRSDGRSLLLTDRAELRQEPGAHQSADYLDLLAQSLDIGARAAPVPLPVAKRHSEAMSAWLARRRTRPGAPLVALAVAAAYGPAKEWPAESYASLIDRLSERGSECVLIGAPGERSKCEAVSRASGAGALIAAGESSIGETIALLSLCDGFAGNDSGATHLAAALGLAMVAIFGSTDPVRTGPRGDHVTVLYDRIACSPCLERTCRFGHYDCLRRIDVETVESALRERVAALRAP